MARILVIDDEPLICSMLDVRLSRAGHNVMTAPDGREGVALYRKDPADVVITDIMMPEKDGLETIGELRQANPDLKIIAISGGSRILNADFLEAASLCGAAAVFQKPLDHHQLLQAIDACLEPGSAAMAGGLHR